MRSAVVFLRYVCLWVVEPTRLSAGFDVHCNSKNISRYFTALLVSWQHFELMLLHHCHDIISIFIASS